MAGGPTEGKQFLFAEFSPNGAASLNINTVLITGKSTGCRSGLLAPLW